MPRCRKRRQHDFFFSPRDYLRDPAVLAMRHNVAARGAYSTLLFELWDQDEPGVTVADDRVLAALAWVTPDEWASVRSLVAAAFDIESRPGLWVQKRMVTEHARQQVFLDKARKTGQMGGLEKARRQRLARPPIGTLKGMATASQASQASQAEESTPPTPPSKAAPAAPRSDFSQIPLPDWMPRPLWTDWCRHRLRLKPKGWTESTAAYCLRELTKHRANGHDPVAIVERALAGGWQGFGSPERNGNGHAPALDRGWQKEA